MAGLFDDASGVMGLYDGLNQKALPFTQNNQNALMGAGLELLGGGGYSGAARGFMGGSQVDAVKASNAAKSQMDQQRFKMEQDRLRMAQEQHQQKTTAAERMMGQQNKTQEFIAANYPDLAGLPPEVQTKVLSGRLKGGSGSTFGKQPIYVQGPNGLEIGQLSDNNEFSIAELPEGYTAAPGVQKVDLGTHWGIMDRDGKIADTIPKDLRGAESEKVIGKAHGDAAASYESMKSKLPGLRKVVDNLGELADKATYTFAGRGLDAAQRQLGMEPRDAAIARAEYIAILDNQVLPLLRDTFGAAFTQKEGETLRATLGDPNKSPAEKKAVLDAFIEQKERDVSALGRQSGTGINQPAQPVTVNGYTIQQVD